MKTLSTRPHDVVPEWFVVDAADHTLGRLASLIAVRLRGKHKPQYTPHVDTGDYIVVINAEKIQTTGRKEDEKLYYRHSGYPGGIRSRTLREMRERYPERILEIAVKGMLPKNPLGRKMAKKLKVYRGTEHPHGAQQPKTLEF
ncbi:MAG: 50S ribosomal protein L13 [Gammaproteobacteria bacterium]|nr:50S ribosomal protein L13 [Gammaproteobacteria bacterium]MDE0645825.1 50S ribosomal protein L13 [Gammaproteobacteria bacterium]MXX94735.1 50S ribosomal protein L13 [Gammaproteobacteria bacterium]MYF54147.1 50S ribosomal protein L13 [Gammaproteobacteria bacterium]MYK43858.1 50S ribosomal protein L13 [Gammaproteobacteria bacterium]